LGITCGPVKDDHPTYHQSFQFLIRMIRDVDQTVQQRLLMNDGGILRKL
jgi:hypothetical protein